jgi:hypothetical protein
MTPTRFSYPEWINEVGYQIGMHRNNNNRKLDIAKPQYVRDDKYHIIGATGELIFLLYLENKAIKYESNTLFNDNPVIGYDVLVENLKVDVKTQQVETKFISVGLREHQKISKQIDFYAFVKLLGNNTCDIYRCKKSDVETWKIDTRQWKNETKSFYRYDI